MYNCILGSAETTLLAITLQIPDIILGASKTRISRLFFFQCTKKIIVAVISKVDNTGEEAWNTAGSELI